jgi:hypothetical protein
MMSFTGKNQKMKIEHGLHRCYGFPLICVNRLKSPDKARKAVSSVFSVLALGTTTIDK